MLMQPITMACSGFCNYAESDIAATQRACIVKQTDVDLGLQPIAHAVDVRNLNETKELSGTLQSKASGGYSLNYQNPVRIGYRVRRLTPTECLRLQGMPDYWLDIEGASDSAKYKAVGNSVAVPCVEFIFSQIVKVLRRKS